MPRPSTHKMSRTTEYEAWRSMIKRCACTKNASFSHYGGRGITVCGEWLESFENFFKDVGMKPSPTHSLDRKDVNGNYCKANVRWASRSEQANNKTSNVFIALDDDVFTVGQAAKRFGLRQSSLRQMLIKGVHPIDAVIILSAKKKKKAA